MRFHLVVGDVHHRRAEAAVQAGDLGAHRRAQLGVEVGQRFVQQEHLRLAHQRPAQRHALALAAGQRGGPALQQRPQLQPVGRGFDARGDLGLRHAAQREPERQVLGHGHVRVQRVALEHHRDVAILRRDVVDHAVVDAQRAAADLLQPGDHPQQRGLAAARRPDQHQQLAVGDLEAGAVHGDVAVRVDLAESIERDRRHRQSSSGGTGAIACGMRTDRRACDSLM
jgi:hypothetical protein